MSTIEFRDSQVASVDFDERLIEVIAVPYETPAKVAYRGQIWDELFERGAFDGIEDRQGEVRVNREHTRGDTIGLVATFHPSRAEGLVSEVKISKTTRGDDTLALAADNALSASLGFAVRGRDHILNRSTMTRRIKRAFVDHLSFVESPAYAGAQVLSVRKDSAQQTTADLPQLVTPDLDDIMSFMEARRR